MVSQDFTLGTQRIDRVDQVHQVLRVIQVRHRALALVQGLRQDRAAHATPALAQVNQDQRAVGFLGIELRRERATHIGQRGKGADDQRDRRGDFFSLGALSPDGAHGQRIFADRNRHAQGRAQFHAHGFHGFVKSSVLAGLATSGHPVGRQLDAGQLDRRGQQVGDGFGHRHAGRGSGVGRGQRRALAHAHGLAGKALVVGQRHSAVGHRHLPRADHLVTVREAAHGAVTDGDEKTLGSHRRMAEHMDHALLQVHAGQVQRLDRARN